jgi:Flp pilus assembly protein CpaB
VRAVGGFLVPGDEVNIMVLTTPLNPSPTSPFQASARYLYQKVQILAIGQSTVLSPGEQASTTTQTTGSSGIITFNVPPDAAQYIAMAQSAGNMYLSLAAKDYVPKELPPPEDLTVLPGEDPAKLTPYGPEGNPE